MYESPHRGRRHADDRWLRSGVVRGGCPAPQKKIDERNDVLRSLAQRRQFDPDDVETEITSGRLIPRNLPDFAVGLQSSWEVDLWGRLRSQRQSAIARYLATVEGTNLVRTELIAAVASAYFDLLALDHVREILRRSAQRQAEAVEVVRLQKQAGRANDLAVRQFEAQLADTLAMERESVQQGREAENTLNLLLGRFPQPVPRDKAVLFGDPPGAPSAGVPSDLLVNRPDVRAAEMILRAAKFDLQAARAAFFPSFTITAGGGYQAFEPSFLFRTPESMAYSAAGALVAPLVNRRALEAQFAGAKADQIEAMHEYQRALLVAVTEVTNALSNVRAVDDVLAARRDRRAALERAVGTADDLYRAGKATYLEVLLAQQTSLQADIELVEASRARRVANVAVYRALGGGWQ